MLFNFVEATQLSTTGFSFAGSVLATQAHYNFNNGNVEGNLVAASVSGSGEFHNFKFEGDLPPFVQPPVTPEPTPTPVSVPEPAMGLGLIVGAAGLLRRRCSASESTSIVGVAG